MNLNTKKKEKKKVGIKKEGVKSKSTQKPEVRKSYNGPRDEACSKRSRRL